MPNRLDSVLLARNQVRKIEADRRAQLLSLAMADETDRLLRRLSRIAAGGAGDFARDAVRVRSELEASIPRLQRAIQRGLEQAARWGWDSAADAWIDTLPPIYWRKLRFNLRLPESLLPLMERDPENIIVGPLSFRFGQDPKDRRKKRKAKDQRDDVKRLLFPPPSAERVQEIIHEDIWDGKGWEERIESLSHRVGDKEGLARQFATGMSEGANVDELRSLVMPYVENLRSSAQRIARTEARRVTEAMQRESWKAADDVIAGFQIVATLDQFTRPEHALRNGRIYWKHGTPSEEEMPALPDEPNCRCWYSPVLKPPQEVLDTPGAAADFHSLTDPVPDPVVYSQWFASADAEQQAQSVGRQRLATVRDMLGNSRPPDWSDFIDPTGRLLAIDEIKGESVEDRQARKIEVEQAMQQRETQLRQVFAMGFVSGAA